MPAKLNPAQQPCGTCANYSGFYGFYGFCRAIRDSVHPMWTGCIRWKPKPQPK